MPWFWPFNRKPQRQQATRTILVFALDQEGDVDISFAPAGASSSGEHDRNMFFFCVFIRDLLRGDERIRNQLLDTIGRSQRLPPQVMERTVKTLEKMGGSQDVISPNLVFPDAPHQ
jgi:hypothetical protein